MTQSVFYKDVIHCSIARHEELRNGYATDRDYVVAHNGTSSDAMKWGERADAHRDSAEALRKLLEENR